MKTCLAIAFTATIGLATFSIVKADEEVSIRPWFGMGYTLMSNDVSATYDAAIAADIERNHANGGFGLQILKTIQPGLKLGMEGSFLHTLNETTTSNNHPLTPNAEEYCYHGINSLALVEFDLTKRLFVQAGSGLNTSVKPNNRFTGTTPYFMLAAGFNLRAEAKTPIPIMLRLSSLETGKGNFGGGDGFGSMVPVTLMAGMSFTM